jgi:segregation and condensation protein B
MSLKAKLEAVIYAAEEPVTLAQLSALFAADALEWKSAQEVASDDADAEQAAPEGETLPLLNAELEPEGLEQPSEGPVAAGPNISPNASPETGSEPDAETAPETAEEAVIEALAEPAVDEPADAEAEAKKLARQRDREVRTILRGLLDELIASYASDDRGIEIKEIAGGYRMATKPECHDAARAFVKRLKPALKLSLPALETLAVIAYKQPVTAPEVNEIRGVDSSGVFGSLLARKLIATAGRKQVIGRPILYKTTKEFLLRFGLKDVTELPSMDEFEKMAQLEFEDMEPAAGEEATESIEGPEIDEDPDEPLEPAATGSASESTETAATADSKEAPAAQTPDTNEPVAGTLALEAETTPAEAAPAAPFPLEQAETETVPHD